MYLSWPFATRNLMINLQIKNLFFLLHCKMWLNFTSKEIERERRVIPPVHIYWTIKLESWLLYIYMNISILSSTESMNDLLQTFLTFVCLFFEATGNRWKIQLMKRLIFFCVFFITGNSLMTYPIKIASSIIVNWADR